jgi:argonaute-like protein implicated in RNA metabolism and viral defense
MLKTEKANVIIFNSEGFILKFNFACVSYGQIDNPTGFPQKTAYQFDEPAMLFNVNDKNSVGINQLKGISIYGPIDYSYSKSNQSRDSIKLVIISPSNDIMNILNHLGKLKDGNKLIKDDGFTPVYNGFERIYKRALDIPQPSDGKRCICYDEKQIATREQLVNILKSKIDKLSSEPQDFDILVIYIPQSFEQFRLGSDEEDFNLHDAIKLYAMDKLIKVQFVEEKSFTQYEPCKVMWALSAGLYAKSGGILWRPYILNADTAFVGISYAISKEKGISVGCSQLFDASGTGLRLLLRKIKDPQFIMKNPFMKVDEARQMMSTLREQYYKSTPASSLNRIVIHKTTFFTQDEIKGFTQALEGIEDIELLQIQEFTSWRGIRYKNIDVRNGVYNYSMKRGTVVQLSDDKYLLWTHGCIISNELWGFNKNYYKGGRGIPAPLMIKRFYGRATGDVLTNEILMLTKMNWNSGDSLYKHLPVTLDFSKVLSRMSKQNEALYDKLYDFRYFM